MSPSRPLFRELGLVFLSVVLPVKAGFAQQTSNAKPNIPIELQAADPAVRALLEAAEAESGLGHYDLAISKAKAALELAHSKGFVGDKAICEEIIASGYAVSANLDESFRFYQASFQDAVDSSNLVLQGDVLVALSMLPGMEGNQQAAIDLLTKAQNTADQSKNLYLKSRVLGRVGKAADSFWKARRGRQINRRSTEHRSG